MVNRLPSGTWVFRHGQAVLLLLLLSASTTAGSRTHFDMQMGDTILASRSGRVLFARDIFADGTRVCGEENLVVIEHADGTVMQYVHVMRATDRMQKAPPAAKADRAFAYPVGETGFEPATPASRTQCSTGLSYSPNPCWTITCCFDGRGGIRTHEGFHPTRFPIVLLKPLGHPSPEPAVHSAERVGFEPTRAFRARRFSKPLP
jgi:hypothetical protein